VQLPRLGTSEQFAALRGFLKGANYTETSIVERLQFKSVRELGDIIVRRGFEKCVAHSDPLNILIRLFLLGEYIPASEAETLPRAVWSVMGALGLIADQSTLSDRFASTVALYPVGDRYFISDRWSNADHSPMPTFADIVYPAFTQSTQDFLLFLPEESCDNFLELCSGSGVAAIHAARYAKRAWASDITHRSTGFALFNAALNDTQNVTVLEGDLFSPLRGLTFDRIAAHPPYMPVLQAAEIYFGGGEDGEQVTRRLVAELPDYLRPGGRLYCRTLGTDRTAAPFEVRVREWLGAAGPEFDIGLFISQNVEPYRFAVDSALKKQRGPAEVEEWRALFSTLGVTDIVTGALVIQRVAEPRRVFTVRRAFGAKKSRELVEWTLRWETAMAQGKGVAAFFQMKPRIGPRVELLVTHQQLNGELRPRTFTLKTTHPFILDCKVQPWMCDLLTQADGLVTVEQLFADAKSKGWIHPQTPAEEFARLLGVFVSGGFLVVDEARLPAAEE